MQVRQQAETITEYREELARLESHILVDVDCVNMLVMVLMFRLEEGVWAGGQGCPILDHRFLNSSSSKYFPSSLSPESTNGGAG